MHSQIILNNPMKGATEAIRAFASKKYPFLGSRRDLDGSVFAEYGTIVDKRLLGIPIKFLGVSLRNEEFKGIMILEQNGGLIIKADVPRKIEKELRSVLEQCKNNNEKAEKYI